MKSGNNVFFNVFYSKCSNTFLSLVIHILKNHCNSIINWIIFLASRQKIYESTPKHEIKLLRLEIETCRIRFTVPVEIRNAYRRRENGGFVRNHSIDKNQANHHEGTLDIPVIRYLVCILFTDRLTELHMTFFRQPVLCRRETHVRRGCREQIDLRLSFLQSGFLSKTRRSRTIAR